MRASRVRRRAKTMNDIALGHLLGSGKEAEVFECGTRVVKLYKATAPKRSAFREAAILALVEPFGLPAPSVYGVLQIGDRWGVMMDRVEGQSFGDVMTRHPELIPAHLEQMALLQLRVHCQPGTQFASLKARLRANIQQSTAILGEARQSALLSRLAVLPEGDRLCHGDFHPLNILGPMGRETLVDWLDATYGDPAADVCRSYVLIKPSAPEVASAYVDAYAGVSGVSRAMILRWMPFVAAARLAEGVPSETDELMEMADSLG
jgi:aminoglycoside phosphotransferase (APT) family kinase protein